MFSYYSSQKASIYPEHHVMPGNIVTDSTLRVIIEYLRKENDSRVLEWGQLEEKAIMDIMRFSYRKSVDGNGAVHRLIDFINSQSASGNHFINVYSKTTKDNKVAHTDFVYAKDPTSCYKYNTEGGEGWKYCNTVKMNTCYKNIYYKQIA
jgi:hypothetical protein